MRLSPHAFVTFWDVHAWSGVTVALLLHVMFFFGAFTVMEHEIAVWENPAWQERAGTATAADVPALIERFVPAGRNVDEVRVNLGERTRVSYRLAGAKETVSREIDWAKETARPRGSAALGRWFEDLHYLSFRQARWLERVAGIACIVMGLALVTGVLIHLKDLIRQLFQLRTGRGMKVFWSDAHKLLGVWGLPFSIFFAWTGALLTLDDWLMEGAKPLSDPSAELVSDRRAVPPQGAAPSVAEASALPIPRLIQIAEREVPNWAPRNFTLRSAERAGSTLELSGEQGGVFQGYSRVLLDMQNGAVLKVHRAGVEETPWEVSRRWLYQLHYAHFAGTSAGGVILRLLYGVGALLMCVLFLSGNWIWLSRRDPGRQRWGNRALARLTVAFGAGLSVATGLCFVASRVLPLGVELATYQTVFFAGWAVTLVWAFIPRSELAAWWQQFLSAGVLFAVSPVVALRYSSSGLFGSGSRSGAAVGVDVGLLACAAGCLLLAARLRGASRPPSAEPAEPSRKPAPNLVSEPPHTLNPQ